MAGGNAVVRLHAEGAFEVFDQFRAGFDVEFVEILLAPANGRQGGHLVQAQQRPVRFALFEADQKRPVRLRHISMMICVLHVWFSVQ